LERLYLCVSLLGCVFIYATFASGWFFLIVLMPISNIRHRVSARDARITGLNPLNLLLVGTLGSCVLHGLFDGSIRRFLPAGCCGCMSCP